MTISFNGALLEAVRTGQKTVTRRRFASQPALSDEPERFRLLDLDERGARFQDVATGRCLPAQNYPFGLPGEYCLTVVEAPDLQLEITAVRVERVRDITVAGALAEGVRLHPPGAGATTSAIRWGGLEVSLAGGGCWYDDPVTAFAHLLTSFYPLAWERNAWVWVVDFSSTLVQAMPLRARL